MRLIYILFAIFLGLFSFNAQNFTFGYNTINYNINNGFPSSEVYYGVKDSHSFFWFCTDKGLAKYNGIDFEYFTLENNLADNTITSIFEDESKNLWFVGDNSLSIYHLQSNIITPYKYNNKLLSFQLKSPIKTVFIDSQNKVYIILKETGYITIDKDGLTKYNSSKVFYERKLGFFAYKNHSYVPIYWRGNQLQTSAFPVNSSNINSEFYYSNYNLIYNTSPNTLTIKNLQNYTSQEVHCDSPINSVSYSVNKDMIYISTKNGLTKYFIKENYFTLNHNTYDINFTLENNNNGIFLLTNYNGLFIVPNNGILTLYQNDNKLLKPISKTYSSNSGVYIQFENENTSLEYTNYGFKNISNVVDIEQLYTFHAKTFMEPLIVNTSHYSFLNSPKLSQFNCISFAKNNNELAILNQDEGIYLVKNNTIQKIQFLNPIIFKSTSLCFYNDQLWIGTLTGWYIYDLQKHTLNHIKTYKNYTVKGMANYNNQCMIIGTKNNGVLVFKNNNYKEYSTTSVGLLSNLINDILVDDHHLWVASSKGIVKMGENNSHFYILETYSISDGLNSTDISSLSKYNDEIYAGSKYGLNKIKDFIKFKNNLSIYIKSIYVNNKPFPLNKIINIPNNNSLEVNLMLASYNSKSPTIYYRIKEINEEFRKSKNLTINYESLSYGNYTLEFFAKDYIEQTPIHTLGINVNPPILAKWYILIPIILILGYLSFYFIRLYFEKIEDKYKKQQEINRYKLLAFNKQMSSHFISNSFNAINNFILKNDNVGGSKYLSRMSKLFRHSLLATEKNYIPFNKEIEAISSYIELEKLRYNDSFDFEIIIDPHIPTKKIAIMPLILQTLIENAIWHGLLQSTQEEKKLSIHINKSNYPNLIQVVITDNGIGINNLDPDKEDSRGIHLVKSILETNNYTKVVEQEKIINFVNLDTTAVNKGTICTLYIPIIIEV